RTTSRFVTSRRHARPRRVPLCCGCDELVEGRVQTFVDYLLTRVRVEPAENLGSAACEGNGADEFRHQGLDLAVVEDQRMGLVPQQRRADIRGDGRDGLGRDVNQLRRWRAGCFGEDLVDLVPWQVLVGGDGEAVPDGLRTPEQPDKSLGEVAAVCQGPQRGAITVYHYRLPGPHPGNVRPAAG